MTLTSTTAASDARTWSFSLSNRVLLILASVLIFLPSALFATGLRPAPALLVLFGCLGSLALITSRASAIGAGFLDASIDRKRLALCIALACFILVLGGELHLFFATLDWRTRDAVLADLARSHLPFAYDVAGVDYILRAPLGMYMLPAAVGHVFELVGAHAALLTQNAILLGSIFYILGSLGLGWPHVAVLILFGGLSVLGECLSYAIVREVRLAKFFEFGLDAWHPWFQYSSSMVQFFWVPNHALPGWWLATLLLLQARSEVDTATVGVSIAGAIFWSPLVVIPVAFWLVYLAATDWRRHLLAWRTWIGLVIAACFLPVAMFMVLGSSDIPHELPVSKPLFIPMYIVFICVQLPAAYFVYINRVYLPGNTYKLFLFATIALLVLPLYSFGPGNDLVMRGSIAPLVILAFAFGGIVCNTDVSRRVTIAGLILITLSMPSALLEITRSIKYPRYDMSDCTLMEARNSLGEKDVPTNYIVESAKVPSWLMETKGRNSLVARSRRCWTDMDKPHE